MESHQNHSNGWEKEKRFHEALRIGIQQHSNFKARTLSNIIKTIDPTFSKDLFKYRPCRRRLRYIGDLDSFFQVGKEYESTEFNGATYRFSGYDRAIGYAYFEVVK
jgi:hypothetical protein